MYEPEFLNYVVVINEIQHFTKSNSDLFFYENALKISFNRLIYPF